MDLQGLEVAQVRKAVATKDKKELSNILPCWNRMKRPRDQWAAHCQRGSKYAWIKFYTKNSKLCYRVLMTHWASSTQNKLILTGLCGRQWAYSTEKSLPSKKKKNETFPLLCEPVGAQGEGGCWLIVRMVPIPPGVLNVIGAQRGPTLPVLFLPYAFRSHPCADIKA